MKRVALFFLAILVPFALFGQVVYAAPVPDGEVNDSPPPENLPSFEEISQQATNVVKGKDTDSFKAAATLPILDLLVGPIIQAIINESKLSFNTVEITAPANNAFTSRIKGELSHTGPVPATISFVAPTYIYWKGKAFAKLRMPSIKTLWLKPTPLDLNTNVEVVNPALLQEFSVALLTGDNFTWDLYCSQIQVTALGITIGGVQLRKTVSLKGMSGLKGVQLTSFNLPGNDPAGGITSEGSGVVKNPSQVGLTVGHLGFNVVYKGIVLGNLAADKQGIAPLKDNSLSLKGRLVPQTSAEGLAAFSEMVNLFIKGKDVPLSLVGNEASDVQGRVDWLSNALPSLKLDIALKPPADLKLIQSINFNDMSFTFTKDTAYNPQTGSKDTQAVFKSPFGFPLDIKEVGLNLAIQDGGKKIAVVAGVKGPATTTPQPNGGLIKTSFGPIPLPVDGAAHEAFNQFVSELTNGAKKDFNLAGTVNTVANTAVGQVTLQDVPVDVSTSLPGMQGLASKPPQQASKVKIFNTPTGLGFNVDYKIFNPAPVTVGLGNIKFATHYKYNNRDVHFANSVLQNVVLNPGDNVVSTVTITDPNLDPEAKNASIALQRALIKDPRNPQILLGTGTQDSTDIESLKLACSKLKFTLSVVALWNGAAAENMNLLAQPEEPSAVPSVSSVPASTGTAVPTVTGKPSNPPEPSQKPDPTIIPSSKPSQKPGDDKPTKSSAPQDKNPKPTENPSAEKKPGKEKSEEKDTPKPAPEN
ncbi:uncharacterized protein VTP21DRAFT_6590 [Calcarisporiella thermophila]|uniref:uncharacterized protein n=1 Tax=Calcarisporiella thermophila TaxID=911321 RepID=UPI0037444EF5